MTFLSQVGTAAGNRAGGEAWGTGVSVRAGDMVWDKAGCGVVAKGRPVLRGSPVIIGFTTRAIIRIITSAPAAYITDFLSMAEVVKICWAFLA